MDMKRRLEETLDTYEFEMNTVRDRYEADLRERTIRSENMERTLNEIRNTHRQEMALLEEKLKSKES
jgi:hypothetical protein